MGTRSPSPSGSLGHSKRRKYDDDDARHANGVEPSSSSRSGQRDRDRDRERDRGDRSRDYDRDRSSRRDGERTGDARPQRDSRGERERERERDRDRDRDRDRSSYKRRDSRDRDRDRDEPRRGGGRREDGPDDRDSRGGGGGSRRGGSPERDRRDRDERGFRDDRGSERVRSTRGDESTPTDKRRSSSRSPSPAKAPQRADHRRERYNVEGSPVPSSHPLPAFPESKPKPSFVSTFNSTPLAASPSPGPSSPSSASTPVPASTAGSKASEEEEKLRIKREKLEAWKAKKAKEAAANAAPSSSAAIPAKPIPSKPSTSNLPLKPASAPKSSLPAKPIGFQGAAPPPTSDSRSLDPAAQALAAAAAISSRLAARSSSSTSTSIPLLPSASLPAKPSFSFVNPNIGSTMSANPTPFRSAVSLAKPSNKVNGLSLAEDDEVETRVGLVPFSSGAAGVAAAQELEAAGDLEDEEDDDEDLEGGVVFKAREGGRDGRIVDSEKTGGEGEGEDVEMVDAKPVEEVVEMVVEEEVAAPVAPEVAEEEEIDELDMFMSTVQAQVKNVDMEDQAKLSSNGKPFKSSKVSHLIDPEADGQDPEEEEAVESEDEIEKVGMTAADILALAAKKVVKRGRELHAIDHSKVDYEPFQKAFYHAPPEVDLMTPEEVEEMRIEMDGIKVRGAEAPKPAAKWSYCGLPAPCIEVIKGLGYTAPTSIQAQAIPAIMSGRDIIGVAKTGSGKTIAFLLPMFRHIKAQRPLKSMDGPIGMIMTPTRELATQIHKECKPFLKALGLRASCAYGGTPLKDNIAEMKRGSEIIVCTPGRMIELLTTNAGKIINLHRVTYLVLDEADRMFDMGFEPQVMKIINQIRPDRQTVLFSATFPRQMEALARKILRRPLEITVGGRSIVAPEIEQIVEVREESTKFNRLLELLGKLSNDDADARTLIFVERQDSADKLLAELLRKNYSCMSLHGGMEQVDRDQTIVDFKTGVVPVVIATSVAARGLDVKQLKLVVQYDAPNHMEDYVHRAGRTGRAGNKGTCVTFVTPDQDRYALDIFKALVASSAVVSDELRTLAEAFAEKIKAGKVSAAGSGFGGKGLDRLDHERDAQSRAERAAYGEAALPGEKKADEVVAGGDAPVVAPVIDVADLEVEIKRGPAPEPAKKTATPAALNATISDADAKAAEAAALAAGKPAGVAKAASVIAAFNAMLKAKSAARSSENNDTSTDSARRRDPDATDYHAIIYINDYPQKARWKVTNKDTMVQLIETTGAAITNKGVFYEPGKEPGPDELPKLHLLIESNDEFRVKHAISEIKRSLIEGATMALEAEQRGTGSGPPGRYLVN